jgi:hypothetical protein
MLKKWRIDYLLTAMRHQLASAGLSISSSGNQSSRRILSGDMTIKGPDVKI